jgi:uncharacterized membrane protein YccC
VDLIWGGGFIHWLPITVILTMQPFYAATLQRALERTAGTVVGCLIGALLALAAPTPIALAGMLLPLSILGFAARQVSYGAFVACFTPQLVVLVELLNPSHSSWEIAAMRSLCTLTGGAVAILGCVLLWPSWEPDRLRRELSAVFLAMATSTRAAFDEADGQGSAAASEAARRESGIAINNLEASVSRALQEPRRRQPPRLDDVLVVDTTLRRLTARLAALRHASAAALAADAPALAGWRDWAVDRLTGLAGGTPPAAPRPMAAPQSEALARVVRQIELLEGTMRGLAD